MCQYWASRMFTKEVVGTANALCGGWGNLGGGVTQLVMGSVLFPLFKVFYNDDSEKAWRTVTVVPAVVAMATGITIYFISDDAPKGNYVDLKKNGSMPEVSAAASFRTGAINFNTWVLFLQYAGCFGVELTMNNAAALYFKDEFGQSTEQAAAIASIFGWMNLFARGLGGFLVPLGQGLHPDGNERSHLGAVHFAPGRRRPGARFCQHQEFDRFHRHDLLLVVCTGRRGVHLRNRPLRRSSQYRRHFRYRGSGREHGRCRFRVRLPSAQVRNRVYHHGYFHPRNGSAEHSRQHQGILRHALGEGRAPHQANDVDPREGQQDHGRSECLIVHNTSV